MTRQDKRWLIVGVLAGALFGGAAVTAVFLRSQRTQPAETATMPMSNERAAAATTAQLSPEDQARIGLQLAEVRREPLTEDIVVIGRVVEPETAIGTVSTRFGGRVERLFATYAGQPVKKGEPVAIIAISGQPVGKDDPVSSIYSRDLIAATAEYKFALENKQRAQTMSRPEAAAQAEALLEASRVRLERFGIKADQIDSLLAVPERPAQPEQPIQVTVIANTSGIVRSRKVTEGEFVNAGDALIELTDLSTVWVKADVFDTQLARIRPGLNATIQSEALPGVKLSGVVNFIDPQSDPQTRTTPVRIQVDNPGIRLKPGMLVQPTFHLALGNVLTVPREAVIDTGDEKFVYIAGDNGAFRQQSIQTGTPIKDRYPVLGGLKEGDRVVRNGVFLIDSQTRLTGGLTGMFGGSKSYTDTSPAPAPSTPGAYKMTVRIDPDPPQGAQQNTVRVSLVDAAGKPVMDANVRASFQMPAMPAMNMPEMRNGTELKWTGSDYVGPIQIMMAGGWNVTVEARRGNEVLTTVQTHINAR
jgi:RND family efflux transporter MFP subunit